MASPSTQERPTWLVGLLGLLALALTGGCATRPPVRSTVVVVPAHPRNATPQASEGLASWYGREQHGGPTASGERFNMYHFTAAHRTLRMGTSVRVTNLRNGRSAVVRINDRGPYSGHRIIDLSYAAARALDMLTAGVVKVRLEVLSP